MTGAPPEAGADRPPLSLRYHVWLYSPPELRELTAALFAIEREIAASTRPGIDHSVAHARLEWWAGECGRIAAAAPVHPLGQALDRAWSALPVAAAAPRPTLAGLLVNAHWDLAAATFESHAELEEYCTRWAECIPMTLALAAGGADGAVSARDHARQLGAALKELELLDCLAAEARVGRLRLPLETLGQRGVAPETLARPPWPAALAELLGERLEALQRTICAALRALPPAERRATPALAVWVSLAARRAEQGRRALPGARAERRRDLAAETLLAWQAARRARAGRCP